MNEEHAVRTGKGVVIRLVIGLGAAAGAWLVLRHWASVAHEIAWDCAAGECGTNDPRAMLVVGGGALALLASAMLVTVVRLAGFGLVLALASMAMVTGWQAALADGQVTADSVSGEVGVWRAVAIVGAVIAGLGLVVELRVPGPSWRLFGWRSVPAELGDHHHDGTAALAFTDRHGGRHVVRTAVPELLRERPVRAFYHAGDPTRVRVMPGQQTPQGGDEDAPASLSTELTRLAALHAEGHLTDAEFEQAKRRVLGG